MSDEKGTDWTGIVDLSVEMLMTGHDLYVNKNDYAPARINARTISCFERNAVLLDQHVDLCWTSKRGFRVGVVFTGLSRNVLIQESFPGQANTFIARFDLDSINKVIQNALHDDYRLAVKSVMSEPNAFSSWLYWPAYPLTSATKLFCEEQDKVSDFSHHAYEQWVHSYGYGGGYQTKQLASEPSAPVPTVRLHGYKTSKTTGERVYRFSVTVNKVTEQYHIVAYEGEYYLLDYAYDSVPYDHPLREKILAACRIKLPTLSKHSSSEARL